MIAIIVLLGLAAGLVALVVQLYNALVRLRNASESAWSDVDVQLVRRADLVPNLVETVKGFAAHERGTLEEVVKARGQVEAASGVGDRASAESGLSRALGGLFALAEAYPELRSDQNFRALQEDLAKLEDAIQKARRYYNAVVRDLNTRCEAFPSNLVANQFGFHKADYFELDDPADRQAPAVSFGG